MLSLGDTLLASLEATGAQLVAVLGPLAACAVVLHQLQRVTAARLTTSFGPRAMLGTGWLGVPIHELSHVVACALFMHEIEEVRLFSPSAEDGTLGLVRHRAPAGNPWAEIGRFFIGVAPLIGGSLALWAVARLLLPSAALDALGRFDVASGSGSVAFSGLRQGAAAAASILDPAHLRAPAFWLFLYLATCVGVHLAPSRHDLRGAARGALAVVALLFVANVLARALGVLDPDVVTHVAAFTTPFVALLVLAAFLSAMVLALVLIVTLAHDRMRGAAEGQLSRLLRDHGLRLVVAALGCAGLAWAATG